MSDLPEDVIAGLVDSFNACRTQDHEEVEHHKNLAIQAVSDLNDKFMGIHNFPTQVNAPPVIFGWVQVRTKLREKLVSFLFPTFSQQVTALAEAVLDLSDSSTEPISKLKLVVEVVSVLGSTMEQLTSCLPFIHPAGLHPRYVSHDKDFKKLKAFITHGLVGRIYEATEDACGLFRSSLAVIEQLGHSLEDQAPSRTKLLTMKASCLESIDQVKQFVDKSEVDIIRDRWQSNIASMSKTLDSFLELASAQSPQDTWSESRTANEDDDEDDTLCEASQVHGPSENEVEKSTIAIVKLGRSGFTKLLRLLSNKHIFTIVTNLPSKELHAFSISADLVSKRIGEMVEILCKGYLTEESRARGMTAMRRSISDLLNAPNVMLPIIKILVPLRAKPDQPSPMIHLKPWFYQWKKHFFLAIQNFLEAGGFDEDF
ncbi:hypothetical protein, variant [Puccinia triticina 1-1 BBBD Race 1]|uniref:Uncharacterized protein n=2 Tax=Puccinia triticina TaxID=208348 RepID=A0A180GT61_PUCT1|nr:uncharacterized protein PtA15_6A83 [Puccinia triticina]OAV95163.1 hypothetical protein, variant [Puccinia triticina 1-1 BBBD Race 1]WAQ85455.1 hypothetical protein PtA15_6A83 [Puccinia triticina]WAR55338.1 hypothetical protein PtB15_6B77 [Puccinia triticina]